MKTKIFEVLDRATCMPVVATRLETDFSQPLEEGAVAIMREHKLLTRLGLDSNDSYKILLSVIGSGYADSQIDPYGWGDSRTRVTAHKYIEKHFDTLENGAVVDVEFILGECEQPHPSDLDQEYGSNG
jgi:hypothetical protein